MARTRQSITSGTTENNIYFYPAGGHSHNGQNSTLIDTTKYSVYDFNFAFVGDNPERRTFQSNSYNSMQQLIKDTVTTSVLEPAGIVLQPNTLNGASIIARTITANLIAANTITANELAANIILVNNIIQSNNYSAGVSGWRISNTGSAEFNDVTVRGTVVSSSGTIGGFTIGTTTLTGGSGSDIIQISTGGYNPSSNPDELVLAIGGNISSGFAAPFAVNSSGLISAQSATIGPLSLSSSGFDTFGSGITNGALQLTSSGDMYIRSQPGGGSRYYLQYMLGEYFQVRQTDSTYNSNYPGAGAFLGFFNPTIGTTPYMVVNNTTTVGGSFDTGQYVWADGSNGYLKVSGYLYSAAGNEGNNSNPPRVWGSNGDGYIRTYLTSALNVAYATNSNITQYVANDSFNARFHWSGQSGQPTWLWGSNNGSDYYVWNPSNFDVASVGGNTPQTSGFNGGLAVRYSGDARLDSNYFVGYGTVAVGVGASANLRRRSADGYFLIEASRTEYKQDIENINLDDAISILMSLNPVKFNWKEEFDGPEHQNPLMQQIRKQYKEYGFLVEEVENSSPELVSYLDDNDEKKPTAMMWQQNGVISILVKTVQNLVSRIEYLESKG